jgi:hypothetical protein
MKFFFLDKNVWYFFAPAKKYQKTGPKTAVVVFGGP